MHIGFIVIEASDANEVVAAEVIAPFDERLPRPLLAAATRMAISWSSTSVIGSSLLMPLPARAVR
jgi:hypothetical protein